MGGRFKKFALLVINGPFRWDLAFSHEFALADSLPDLDSTDGQCYLIVKNQEHTEILADLLMEYGCIWKDLGHRGQLLLHESVWLIHAPLSIVKSAFADKKCIVDTFIEL